MLSGVMTIQIPNKGYEMIEYRMWDMLTHNWLLEATTDKAKAERLLDIYNEGRPPKLGGVVLMTREVTEWEPV